MNMEFWTSKVNEWITKHFPREMVPIGLEHRTIFDGAGKDTRQKMSKDEKWAKCTFHVLCKHGVQTHAMVLIQAFLCSMEFSLLCKVPAHLIPPLPYLASLIFQQKYKDATIKHMKVMHFGTSSQNTFDFSNLDKPCHVLEGSPTIQKLLLSIATWNSTTPLFLSVNPAWKSQERGGFVIACTKQHEMEAVEKISSLLAFFKHHFREASLEHFAQEALNQAEMTQWDMEHDHPIIQEEMFLNNIAVEDDDVTETL